MIPCSFLNIFVICINFVYNRIAMTRLDEHVENFNKFFTILSDVVETYNKNKNDVIIHMALVQSFEVCFELSWKILKDYLSTKGIEVYTPRDVIKTAFNSNIIKNGQIWIDMSNDRNASSHEYNMDKVNKIIERISDIYYEELKNFAEQIKEF